MTIRLKLLYQIFNLKYLIIYQNNHYGASILINIASRINTITCSYARKLSQIIQKSNIKAQKIGGLAMVIYKINIISFLL